MSVSKGPKRSITAAELARLKEEMLRNDPEYRAKFEAVEAERRERTRRLREAEQPIIDDLRVAGVEVESVWDLVNTAEPYPAALPVLVEHLERGGYPDRVLESLGRALAVKSAHSYWPTLRELYLRAGGLDEREGLALALTASATAAEIEPLVALLAEDAGGDERIHFLRPILKLGGERGRQIVESLRTSPVFGKEASALLKRRPGRS